MVYNYRIAYFVEVFLYQLAQQVKLYYHDKEEITTKFIYSPNKAVHLNESNSKLYELKYLGDGWYFLKQLPDPDVVTDY